MSVKQTLDSVLSGYNIATINANFTLLNNALENVVARDGTSPNAMSNDLDMGSNQIINVSGLDATSLTINGNPAAGFDWQGSWVTSTAYTVNQAVTHNGSSYVVTTNHTASATNEPGVGAGWDSVWDVTAQKGDTGATGATGPAGDGSGDVLGPAVHADNALPRFDGANNKTLQTSGIDVSDTDSITGVNFMNTAFLGIGTVTAPHSGVGAGKFAMEGSASNAAFGPHAQFTIDTDDHPTMQILNWDHDNIGILYDCYFDGTNWKSSDAGSNFRSYKNGDRLGIWYDSGIAAGSNITWNIGWAIDSAGQVSIGTTVAEAALHVEGQIRIDDATARLELLDSDAGDEFHVQNDGGVFKVINSTDSSRVDLQIDGDGSMTPYNMLRPIRTVSGTTDTLVITDAGKKIRCTNAAAVTVTVPTNASVAFPIGTVIMVHQNGTGQVSIASPSVTVNSRNSNVDIGARHVTVELHKVGTDEWDLIGDLV